MGISNLNECETLFQKHHQNLTAAKTKIAFLDPDQKVAEFFYSHSKIIMKTMMDELLTKVPKGELKQRICTRPVMWSDGQELDPLKLTALFVYHVYREHVILCLDALKPKLADFMEYFSIVLMSEWNCHVINKIKSQVVLNFAGGKG